MANSFTKTILSGSTNGRGILLAAVATPGTIIHTAVAGAVNIDEVWIWVVNNHTVAVDLAIEYGGVTDPADVIRASIDFKKGLFLMLPGLVLQNSLIVRGFASVTNVISVHGFVNRITT